MTLWNGVIGVVVLFGFGCLLGWSFHWGVITSGLALAVIGVVSVAAIYWRSGGSQID